MSAFFGTKYAGFIIGAYGATFVVLLAMMLWVWFTARSRRAQLARLEADGLRRASAKTSNKGA